MGDRGAVEVPLDEVRAVLGLQPVVGFGFPKLSVAFLRRKAEEQLRDALGRFRRMRGTLEPDVPDRRGVPGGRASLPGDTGALMMKLDSSIPDRVRHDRRWGRVAVPMPSVRPAPSELYGQDVADVLRANGETPETVKRFSDGYAMFTRNGRNTVMVPTPYREAKNRWETASARVQEGESSLYALEQFADAYKVLGQPVPAPLEEMINRLKPEVARARSARLQARQEMTSVGRDAPLRPYQRRMAMEALDELEDALDGMPKWRAADKDPQFPQDGFRIDMDKSLFDTGVMGFTRAGDRAMAVNPLIFFETPDGGYMRSLNVPEGHMMPTGHQTLGLYTINHELGHMVDSRGTGKGSENRPDIWEAAKATGQLSVYGHDNIYEGYAEAFAMWRSGQFDHPVVKLYADAFGWDRDERPTAAELAKSPGYVASLTDAEWNDLDFLQEEIRNQGITRLDNVSKEMSEAVRVGDIGYLRQILQTMQYAGVMDMLRKPTRVV